MPDPRTPPTRSSAAKRREQSHMAGGIFSGVADGLACRLQPVAIIVGLLSSFERYAHMFIGSAEQQMGLEARQNAIDMIRDGVQQFLLTLDTLEATAATHEGIRPKHPVH
jgi:hypothetical protein